MVMLTNNNGNSNATLERVTHVQLGANGKDGTQAILLKRRLYTPFLQQFFAFDLGPKHCCIQIYLKLE